MSGQQENEEHFFLPSKKETKIYIPDNSKIGKYTNLNQQVKGYNKLPRLQILLGMLVVSFIVGWLAILTVARVNDIAKGKEDIPDRLADLVAEVIEEQRKENLGRFENWKDPQIKGDFHPSSEKDHPRTDERNRRNLPIGPQEPVANSDFTTCPELSQKVPILNLKGSKTLLTPQCVEQILPTMKLYTADNLNGCDLIAGNVLYKESYYNEVDACKNKMKGKRIVVMIHDMVYQTDDGTIGESNIMQEMKEKILGNEESTTVLIVNWSKGSTVILDSLHLSEEDRNKPPTLQLKAALKNLLKQTSYTQAAQNTGYIGNAIAQVLNSIGSDDIHCIGHGLGAHACSFAGKFFKKLNEGAKTFEKITALNPSGPLFLSNGILDQEDNEEDYRLAKDDAKIVDVVHTDDKILGSVSNVGNLDFYPGRAKEELFGYNQPGAGPLESHFRALFYYSKTIGNKCVVDHYCTHPVSRSAVLCSKLTDDQKVTVGYDLDFVPAEGQSYAVDVQGGSKGREVTIKCKNNDIELSTEGITKTIDTILKTIEELAKDPEKLQDPEFMINQTTKIAKAISNTINNDIKEYYEKLDNEYEEHFEKMNELSAHVSEESKKTLLKANKELGMVKIALNDIRKTMKRFAKGTIDKSEEIIEVLNDFIASQQDAEILEYVVDLVEDLLTTSHRQLTDAKKVYATATKALNDIKATLDLVHKDFEGTLKLMRAKTDDSVQDLVGSQTGSNWEIGINAMSGSLQLSKLGTTIGLADFANMKNKGEFAAQITDIVGSLTMNGIALIKSVIERTGKSSKIKELKDEFKKFAVTIQNTQSKIKDSQDATQKEKEKVEEEGELVGDWLEHVLAMREAFDCTDKNGEESNCSKLRKRLVRNAGKYTKPIKHAIKEFEELKKYAKKYLSLLKN